MSWPLAAVFRPVCLRPRACLDEWSDPISSGAPEVAYVELLGGAEVMEQTLQSGPVVPESDAASGSVRQEDH